MEKWQEPGNYEEEGKVFVCLACGKLSKDKYGNKNISYGWDVSCTLHAVLVPIEKVVLDESGTKATEILD